MRSVALLLLLPLLLFLPRGLAAQVPSSGTDLRTPMERSGFARHTDHAGMMEYLAELRARAPDLTLGTYGETLEGRELPYLLFSRPGVTSPAEAHASGKPILLFGANVHGFNHVLRESLLILARRLAEPGSELNALLDDVIVILAPSKNPDGLEADSRFNAAGFDLNRDYMTLDQPSMAAYVGRLVNRWNPHLVVDGHDGGDVQYGGAYPYHLLHQGPALAGADPAITALADGSVFPYLGAALEAEGYRAFYWARGDTERWYGGGAAPRMGRNYGGLANTLSVLFEMTDWPDTEDQVRSGLVGFEAILAYAALEGDSLVGTIREARARTVELGVRAEGRIPVAEVAEADTFRVRYAVGSPDAPDALIEVEGAEIIKRPVGTHFRDRPWGYVLPPEAKDAVSLLLRHGIQVERLTTGVERETLAYTLHDVTFERVDGGPFTALRLQVGPEVEEIGTLPRGSYLVRTGQPLGRVVAHLLEPETTDGVFYWGRMTGLLPFAELAAHREDPGSAHAPLLPIRKLMRETSLPVVRVAPD